LGSALLSVVFVAGCHCSPLFEPYAGFIDTVGEQLPLLEPFYVPQLDLSRMGFPDWCQSPVNRFLAPCECRGVEFSHATLDTAPVAQPEAGPAATASPTERSSGAEGAGEAAVGPPPAGPVETGRPGGLSGAATAPPPAPEPEPERP